MNIYEIAITLQLQKLYLCFFFPSIQCLCLEFLDVRYTYGPKICVRTGFICWGFFYSADIIFVNYYVCKGKIFCY